MTVTSSDLAAMLKRMIPLAQHPEYPEGDPVEVREAAAMLRSYEKQPMWHRETGWRVERDLWKAEWEQISETARVLKIDADRYQFLRQPGNAIVYAKDHHAWGHNASGHVRYDAPEQLDAAVDAALTHAAPLKDQP